MSTEGFLKRFPGMILGVFLACGTGQAADIAVVKAGGTKSQIDVSGFRSTGGEGAALFRRVLMDDLKRSGWFAVVETGPGAYSLQGTCGDSGAGLKVDCRILGGEAGSLMMDKSYKDTASNARRLAHQAADDIVWAVKQVKGIASGRIVMVGQRAGRKDLYLCDADGQNLVQLTHDGAPCIGPGWGPRGDQVIYTSLRSGYPDVYLINLGSRERQRLVKFPGLNLGADISPDGRSLVVTLSKDGNPDLYTLGIGGEGLTRLTRTRRVDEASPCWSPDGARIVYVSNRAGAPHLYVMGRDGDGETRITFHGTENVNPDWGSDGRIAYSSRRNGLYQICVVNPDQRDEQPVTQDGANHEEPSWAPDGRHIVYTHSAGDHSDVYILDTLGDAPVRLTTATGEWYSPAWCP